MSDISELLALVGSEDAVEKIDAAIAEAQAEAKAKIDKLKRFKDMLSGLIGKPRKPSNRKPFVLKPKFLTARNAVALILKVNGPKSVSEICRTLKGSGNFHHVPTIGQIIKHCPELFVKGEDGLVSLVDKQTATQTA
jgi:hypothetical protein